MTTTFLHEDKPQPPDEVAADKPPFCGQCGEEMWMVSVVRTITDDGIDGTYTYECKYCGGRRKIHRHAERDEAVPITPDIA